MQILSPQQIREWDAYTIAHEPILSIDLMERAARKCADCIIEHQFHKQSVIIFCGKGNNGGDGLAIARMLIEAGRFPDVYVLGSSSKGTDDFEINLSRLQKVTNKINFVFSENDFPQLTEQDVVIDALFGNGLNRPLQGLSEQLVRHINNFNTTTIAIDVPSGLFIDKSSKANAIIVARHTLTFQTLKLCFLVAENAPYFGNVKVLDIGLHPAFLQNLDSQLSLVSHLQMKSFLKKRNPFSHKGNFGHAMLIAGNKGKMGAAVLAARACLRSGVGLLTVNIPAQEFPILQISIPEAMCVEREEFKDVASTFSTVGIGPGLGTEAASKHILEAVLEVNKPIVIDADALNIIAVNPEMLNKIPAGSILTPHPKEFWRLAGQTENEFERIQLALKLSVQYPFVWILKGHHTLVAHKGKGWLNTTGNSGMAKGGSGDVLTGILTALVSQGYDTLQAALLGVYLHGLAADCALNTQTAETMIASDIIENLPSAFSKL